VISDAFREHLRESAFLRWLVVGVRQTSGWGSERWFEDRGSTPSERQRRRRLLNAFQRIHRRVRCAHNQREALLMADWLLSHPPEVLPGVLVECGCFRGGSTAKLSLIAAESGRQLRVYDSFTGLPEPAPCDAALAQEPGCEIGYERGDYSSRGVATVQQAVRHYGASNVCEFIPGLFEDTLPEFKGTPAFIFMDVDYISSARTCFQHLWPKLVAGGRFYTHEAADAKFVNGIRDGGWWCDTLGERPPALVSLFGELGYFEKTRRATDSGSTP
jgi:O-methyltransferase